MKKTFLFTMFAQYGTTTKHLSYEYRSFPNYFVLTENKSYYVSVKSNNQANEVTSAESVYNGIDIQGLK